MHLFPPAIYGLRGQGVYCTYIWYCNMSSYIDVDTDILFVEPSSRGYDFYKSHSISLSKSLTAVTHQKGLLARLESRHIPINLKQSDRTHALKTSGMIIIPRYIPNIYDTQNSHVSINFCTFFPNHLLGGVRWNQQNLVFWWASPPVNLPCGLASVRVCHLSGPNPWSVRVMCQVGILYVLP